MGTHARTAQLRLSSHTSQRLASARWLIAGGAGIAAVALAIAATPRSAGADAVLVRALGVAVPLGVGFTRLGRRSADRFALLLIGAGVLWSLTTLAESTDPTVYSLGRVAVWLLEPLLVVLLLTFPRGRLAGRGERGLALAAGLIVAVLYLPAALLAPFPEPSPFATCATHCPPNALQLTAHAPAFVTHVMQPLREALTAMLFAAVTLAVARRMRRTGAIGQRILAPVVGVAALRTLSLAAFFVVRGHAPDSSAAEALGGVYLLSLPALSLAFAGGLLAWRLFDAAALEQLARTLRSRPHPNQLRRAVAGALHDPELQMFYRLPGTARWLDEASRPVDTPLDGTPGRAVTEVSADGVTLAAIVHRDDLVEDEPLLDAVTSHVVTALENEHLLGQLRSSIDELSRSRARLLTVADDERRRIERDLHDGAQQHLVALQIKLELLAERLDAESPANAQRVRAFEEDIATTLDEVRAFGRGVYPALLADRGVGDALHAAARQATIPTTVDDRLTHRYARELESAIYFGCLEALQNAGKHAQSATRVRIAISGNRRLRFDVRDDGAGFDLDTVSRGAGLTNMSDRLNAVGGELQVFSRPGKGTRVTGTIPLP